MDLSRPPRGFDIEDAPLSPEGLAALVVPVARPSNDQHAWNRLHRLYADAKRVTEALEEREQLVLTSEARLKRSWWGFWAATAVLVAFTFLLMQQGNRMLPEPLTPGQLKAYGSQR